jgi:hypothetical protein
MYGRKHDVVDFLLAWDQLLTMLMMHGLNIYAFVPQTGINKHRSFLIPTTAPICVGIDSVKAHNYPSSYLVALKAVYTQQKKLLQATTTCTV